jgi:hypothetical protein
MKTLMLTLTLSFDSSIQKEKKKKKTEIPFNQTHWYLLSLSFDSSIQQKTEKKKIIILDSQLDSTRLDSFTLIMSLHTTYITGIITLPRILNIL